MPSNFRQSGYMDPNSASVTILVPRPDAKIWFDDTPTMQRGMHRMYTTAPLQQSGGTYMIKAQWDDNGRPMDQQRQVQVRPGQSVTVDFRGEKLSTPRP
jgi:uncharacterized protein (TIGR03000 family)